MVTSRRGVSGVERGQGVCCQWKAKGQCSRGDKRSFRHDGNERAKPTPKTAPPSEPPTQRGRSAWRKKNLRGWSPSGKFDRQPCKNFLKGTYTKSLCDYWHPPECQFYKSASDCKYAISARLHTGRLRDNLTKKPKQDGDKSTVAVLKEVRQLSCVSQDTEPPESAAISRKGTRVLGPIRRVRFTRAALRQANIPEDKGPSLGKIQVKILHQRSPNAEKFEDGSQEETEKNRSDVSAETRGDWPRIS